MGKEEEPAVEVGVENVPNKSTRLGLKPEIEAALAYIPIMGLVVALMEHQDPYINNRNSVFYAKYHGFQSLFLFAVYLPVSLILVIIDAVAQLGVGYFSLIWWAVYLVTIVVCAIVAYRRALPPQLTGENVEEQLFSLLCLGNFSLQLTEKYVATSAC